METKMLDIPKVLCVDDEPELLHSVSRSLRRGYLVTTATSGKEALEILRKDQSFAVIMSDMRMPGMDGAEFLAQARLLVPDAVRVLLTGFTEMAPVIHAINDGRIFRFLNKPIEKEQLLSVIDAAAAQHRLQAGEQFIGTYHTHPDGDLLQGVLSETDLGYMQSGFVDFAGTVGALGTASSQLDWLFDIVDPRLGDWNVYAHDAARLRALHARCQLQSPCPINELRIAGSAFNLYSHVYEERDDDWP